MEHQWLFPQKMYILRKHHAVGGLLDAWEFPNSRTIHPAGSQGRREIAPCNVIRPYSHFDHFDIATFETSLSLKNGTGTNHVPRTS